MPVSPATSPLDAQVRSVLASLEQMSTRRDRENLARFGITANKAFGVSMSNIQMLGKRLGRNHDLAATLWDSGWYEARLLTSFVDDPARVTRSQMDRWSRDFDNWGICDTVCFFLFDRTPHAWAKVESWSDARGEFVKRAAFALLASLALHDKSAGDRTVRGVPALHRARRGRRAKLREEGRELGPQGRGAPQPGAQCGGYRDGQTSVGVPRRRSALGGARRPQGADRTSGTTPARPPSRERRARTPASNNATAAAKTGVSR